MEKTDYPRDAIARIIPEPCRSRKAGIARMEYMNIKSKPFAEKRSP